MASPAKAVTNKQGASGEKKSTQRLVLTLKETPDPKQAAKMIIALRNFHVDTLPHWKLTAVHNGRGKGRWVHDRRTKTLFTFVRADDDKRIIREGIEALVADTAITFSAEGFDDAAPAAAAAVLATPARAPSAEPPASAPSAAAAGAAGPQQHGSGGGASGPPPGWDVGGRACACPSSRAAR